MRRVLIANRGEIAVRIIRACHQYGLETVAVYSTADQDSLHVSLADQAICIGDHVMSNSYLNIEHIISAAVISGADAIHPGYGFLSENPEFASMCEKCNITFIGPKSSVISLMGNKSVAREMAIKSGVPVVPGSEGLINNTDELDAYAKEIGYPLIIKASSGGGGRGMRIVENESELHSMYNICQNEALSAFGDKSVYVERFVRNPKHVEVQILADQFGNVVTVGERDCSMQRRNQKLIEETPCMILPDDVRQKLFDVSINLVKEIGYYNAGTIEYIMDENYNFYFIEMNTRIQVEHPVSEEVSGIDLVLWQLKIANGEKLTFTNDEVKLSGHSIEVRITCEDENMNFMPVPGKINFLITPGGRGIRVDSFIYQGYEVSKYYDSMILKIISHGNTREEAIASMKQALLELIIEPLPTNTKFLYRVLESNEFTSGLYNTGTLLTMMSGDK